MIVSLIFLKRDILRYNKINIHEITDTIVQSMCLYRQQLYKVVKVEVLEHFVQQKKKNPKQFKNKIIGSTKTSKYFHKLYAIKLHILY